MQEVGDTFESQDIPNSDFRKLIEDFYKKTENYPSVFNIREAKEIENKLKKEDPKYSEKIIRYHIDNVSNLFSIEGHRSKKDFPSSIKAFLWGILKLQKSMRKEEITEDKSINAESLSELEEAILEINLDEDVCENANELIDLCEKCKSLIGELNFDYMEKLHPYLMKTPEDIEKEFDFENKPQKLEESTLKHIIGNFILGTLGSYKALEAEGYEHITKYLKIEINGLLSIIKYILEKVNKGKVEVMKEGHQEKIGDFLLELESIETSLMSEENQEAMIKKLEDLYEDFCSNMGFSNHNTVNRKST